MFQIITEEQRAKIASVQVNAYASVIKRLKLPSETDSSLGSAIV